MENFKDWYQILEVDPHASDQEIKNSWRKMAMKYHPDRNSDQATSSLFIEAKSAFDILSDPNRRIIFDLERQSWLLKKENASQLVETFGAFSFKQWWSGVKNDHFNVKPLPQADRASIILPVRLADIFTDQTYTVGMRVARTCSNCHGKDTNCSVCLGTGQRFVRKDWQIRVPAGTIDRTSLRLAGQGHQGPRFGSSGDVYVTVVWIKKGLWKWENGRLMARIRVGASTLKKGGVIRLRSPAGKWGKVNIVPGNSEARLIRLPLLGLPDPSGKKSDAWLECYTKSH